MRKKISYVTNDGAAFDDKKEACKHDLEVGIPEKLASMFQEWENNTPIHKYANTRARVAAFVIENRHGIEYLLKEYDEADLETYGER